MILIHRSKDNQWYFTVNALNGKVITTSETYRNQRNCWGGIMAVVRIFSGKKEVSIRDTTNAFTHKRLPHHRIRRK